MIKMAQKDDPFLDKVILFLVVLVGAMLIFNQFQFVKLSPNTLFNGLSFFLILALTGLVIWMFFSKEKHKEHQPIMNIERKPLTFHETFQSY